MNINIITSDGRDWFSRQLSDEVKNKYTVVCNSNEPTEWDVVVVYEKIQSVQQFNCRKGGLIFISGEPPLSSVYTKEFLSQFDIVLSSHPHIKHRNRILWQQSLPWHLGYSHKRQTYSLDYNDLTLLKTCKTRCMSVMCSFINIMPGHTRRNNLVKSLIERYQGRLDLFGRRYHFIDDKAEAILPYKFQICIENSSVPDYWTEKLSDCILGYCVPIYIGCSNISDYFSADSMYICSMDNIESIYNTIDSILQDPQAAYDKKIKGLTAARDKTLHNYNIIETIEYALNKSKVQLQNNYCFRKIKPNEKCALYQFELIKLRINRSIRKQINQIWKR